jgi:hypothetical protein
MGVLQGGAELTSWKAKVRGVLVAALGKDDHLLTRFDAVRYTLSVWSSSTPDSQFDAARHRGIQNACGVIDAAIYQLELQSDVEPIDDQAFDSELWDHVKGLVETGDWGKVAAQTAIFVENHLRTWAGSPKDKNGEDLYGKALYAMVLSDASDWRLGSRAGEREGWRMLGMGFAQAIGTVDRHRIQKRPDARRYAIGVLGLASLLLTQLRYEHANLIEDDADTENV